MLRECRHMFDIRTLRCGWSVCSGVHLESVNTAHADVQAYGPLAGPVQEVPLAEAKALLFFLSNCVVGDRGILTFYTDCLWVSESYRRGEEYCTHSLAIFAGLWCKIFRVVREQFGENLEGLHVIKVRGHATAASCVDDAELNYRRLGNGTSDDGAKAGAAIHPCDSDIIGKSRDHAEMATFVARYIARCAVWRRKTYGVEVLIPVAVPHSRADIAIRPMVSQHRICGDFESLRWRCFMCMRSAASSSVLERSACPRYSFGRHVPWYARGSTEEKGITFCVRCGAYSSDRAYNLKGICLNRPGNETTTKRLRWMKNGYHPVTGDELHAPRPVRPQDEWEFTFAGHMSRHAT